ncbi:MAG: DNA polymerase Y family protein [Fuerstiella sp.]
MAAADDRRFVRALFAAAKGGPAVVASSYEAWRQGVRPGLPLAEARSMATPLTVGPKSQLKQTSQSTRETRPTTEFVEWNPQEDRSALVEAAELTRSFAPIVGLDESPLPDSLMLDITACGPLFGGEAALAELLLKTLKQHGYAATAAIADTVSIAWAITHPVGHLLQEQRTDRRRGDRRFQPAQQPDAPVIVLPPGQTTTAIEQLPVAAARILPADISTLQQLGILLCGQLLQLPIADLPTRLSDACIERIRQLEGVTEELIDAIPERHPVQARWSSEFPLTSLAEIQLVLEQLMHEIAPRLIRQHIGATRMDCLLKDERKRDTLLTAESVTPLQNADALFEILKLTLERTPFRDPLLAVEVTVRTTPLPATRQKDLFQTDVHQRPAEDLAYIINRLSNRLGPESVLTIDHQASAVPEQAIVFRPFCADHRPATVAKRLDDLVTPEDVRPAEQPSIRRPLRLLPVPVTLQLAGEEHPAGEFIFLHENHRVISSAGPERLQTEWWQGRSVHRDYFRIVTDRGAAFWIFRDHNRRLWFLHGVFD